MSSPDIAADWGNGFIMTGMGEPVQLLGGNVTANYFDLLGIHPILGRNFLPEEETKGDVAMVTEMFWRKRLNSDPAVLGRSVTLNGVATTIIGVLPELPISVVRTRHGDFREQAVRSAWPNERAFDARSQFHAGYGKVKAGCDHATSPGRDEIVV